MVATIELGTVQEGKLVKRQNRFTAVVELAGETIKTYVPNPGRLEELMVPGNQVLVSHVSKPDRKTEYDLLHVRHQKNWVSIDSRLPNKLIAKALDKKEIAEITDYSRVRPEYNYGNSRLDFLLTEGEQDILIEVKSVTLIESGVAKFPDAPTKRGRRHIDELIKAKQEGYRTVILFVVQREDAQYFTPCERIDLAFGEKLADFKAEGGEIYAYDCWVSEREVSLRNRLEVEV